jgi:hypothetical protein
MAVIDGLKKTEKKQTPQKRSYNLPKVNKEKVAISSNS